VTLQDLGSIGELLAAIATIATLIYLARQLRANTAAVEGESRRAHRVALSGANLAIASDSKVAALFNAGLRDFDSLQPEQHTQFAFLMAEMIAAWEASHEEVETRLVDNRQLEAIAVPYLVFLRTSGGRKWWESYRGSYPQSFRDYVDGRLRSLAQ
jgi:hypothetical protein